MDSEPINLTHHFLIAMPGLSDESFAKSVIYLCEHSERGALGLVINKPSDINVRGLFDKVDLPLHREAPQKLESRMIEIQWSPVHVLLGLSVSVDIKGREIAGFSLVKEQGLAVVNQEHYTVTRRAFQHVLGHESFS